MCPWRTSILGGGVPGEAGTGLAPPPFAQPVLTEGAATSPRIDQPRWRARNKAKSSAACEHSDRSPGLPNRSHARPIPSARKAPPSYDRSSARVPFKGERTQWPGIKTATTSRTISTPILTLSTSRVPGQPTQAFTDARAADVRSRTMRPIPCLPRTITSIRRPKELSGGR